MAQFGRTRLMGVTIKRFLTQVKRHDEARYRALPEEFRTRYEPSEHRIFADGGKGDEVRRQLRCPMKAHGSHRSMEHTAKQRRLDTRRRYPSHARVQNTLRPLQRHRIH